MKAQVKKRFTGLLSLLLTVGAVGLAGTGAMLVKTASAETTAVKSFVLTDGASIRTASPDGIRFEASISESEFNALEGAQFGVLVMPTELLGEDGVLDFNDTDATNIEIREWDSTIENTKFFYAALVGGEAANFPSEFYNKEISARAYVKYTDSESKEQTYLTNTVGRSMGYVAGAALADGSESSDYVKGIVDACVESISFEKQAYEIGVGGEVALKLVGDNGIPAILTCEQEGCTIADGVFTANAFGDYTVNALLGTRTATTTIRVVDVDETANMVSVGLAPYFTNDQTEVSYVEGVELSGQTVNAIKIQAGSPEEGGQWAVRPKATLSATLLAKRGENTRLYIKLHVKNGAIRLRNIGATEVGVGKGTGEHTIALDFAGTESWAANGIEMHMDNASTVYITEMTFKPAFNTADMVNEETLAYMTSEKVDATYEENVELVGNNYKAIKITTTTADSETGWTQKNYALVNSGLFALKGENTKLRIKLYADCSVILCEPTEEEGKVDMYWETHNASYTSGAVGFLECTVDLTTHTWATSNGMRISIGNGGTATVYITELRFES